MPAIRNLRQSEKSQHTSFDEHKEKMRFISRLKRWLSIYYPEYRTIFMDVTGSRSLFLSEKTVFPEDIISLSTDGLAESGVKQNFLKCWPANKKERQDLFSDIPDNGEV